MTQEQSDSRISMAADIFTSFAQEIESRDLTPQDAVISMKAAITKSINLSKEFHDQAEKAFPVTVEPEKQAEDEEIKAPPGAPKPKVRK